MRIDEERYVYEKEKSYVLRSVFGQGRYTSSQYVRPGRPKQTRDIALLNHRVGLLSVGRGGMGLQLALTAADMSSRMPFDTAAEVLRRFLGYVPSKRSLEGIVDIVGPWAADCLDSTTCPEGDVLVVQVDCRGLPWMTPEEHAKRCKPHQKGRKGRRKRTTTPRRGVGQKRPKKRVTVGMIYALHTDEDGQVVSRGDRYFYARFRETEGVFRHLADKLDALDEPPAEVVFISDGDLHLADLRDRHFPEAIAVIDFYHVCEYLWKASEATAHNDASRCKVLMSLWKRFLLEGNADLVVACLVAAREEIPKRGPGTKGRRKRVDDAIRYLKNRLDYMPYDTLRLRGIDIGSGAIESAVRQIVALRFDGPGMKWGNHRPQHMLHIICARLSSHALGELDAQARHSVSSPQPIQRMTRPGVAERKTSIYGDLNQEAA